MVFVQATDESDNSPDSGNCAALLCTTIGFDYRLPVEDNMIRNPTYAAWWAGGGDQAGEKDTVN